MSYYLSRQRGFAWALDARHWERQDGAEENGLALVTPDEPEERDEVQNVL